MLWMSTDQQQRAQNNLERVLGLAAIAFCPRICHEVGGRLVLYTERIKQTRRGIPDGLQKLLRGGWLVAKHGQNSLGSVATSLRRQCAKVPAGLHTP